jgi:hypothetical protein
VASCVQGDVDAWLADAPTTGHAIRPFFVWPVKNRTCTNITIGHRQAKIVPALGQDQRLAMLKACLTADVLDQARGRRDQPWQEQPVFHRPRKPAAANSDLPPRARHPARGNNLQSG